MKFKVIHIKTASEVLPDKDILINAFTGKERRDMDNSCGDPDCCGGPYPDWQDLDTPEHLFLPFTGLSDKEKEELFEDDVVLLADGRAARIKYEPDHGAFIAQWKRSGPDQHDVRLTCDVACEAKRLGNINTDPHLKQML